jgi:hypothetical protein
MTKPATVCPDTDLMHRLRDEFAKGVQEVEVVHPTEGSRIVTRADFLAIQRTLRAGSPAERLLAESAERRRLAAKFLAVLATAEVRYICEDDEPGVDVFGATFDIEGLTFIDVSQYPPQAQLFPDEVGLLRDDEGKRPSIRLVYHDETDTLQ